MSTNNDTAAILAALDAAGLEIPELKFGELVDSRITCGKYAIASFGDGSNYDVYHGGDCLVVKLGAKSLIEAIAAANAHNRELVAGMLKIKGE